MKEEKLQFVITSSLVQLILILVFFERGHALALIFHKPYVGNVTDGIDLYKIGLEPTLYLSLLMILITTSLN